MRNSRGEHAQDQLVFPVTRHMGAITVKLLNMTKGDQSEKFGLYC